MKQSFEAKESVFHFQQELLAFVLFALVEPLQFVGQFDNQRVCLLQLASESFDVLLVLLCVPAQNEKLLDAVKELLQHGPGCFGFPFVAAGYWPTPFALPSACAQYPCGWL